MATEEFNPYSNRNILAAFIGMSRAEDYTPFILNNDQIRGGYARLAELIARRRAARDSEGPELVLDAGDYSMGTAYGAASRETAGELQLMFLIGYAHRRRSTAS